MPIRLRDDEPILQVVTVPAHGTQTVTLDFENPGDGDFEFLIAVSRVPPDLAG